MKKQKRKDLIAKPATDSDLTEWVMSAYHDQEVITAWQRDNVKKVHISKIMPATGQLVLKSKQFQQLGFNDGDRIQILSKRIFADAVIDERYNQQCSIKLKTITPTDLKLVENRKEHRIDMTDLAIALRLRRISRSSEHMDGHLINISRRGMEIGFPDDSGKELKKSHYCKAHMVDYPDQLRFGELKVEHVTFDMKTKQGAYNNIVVGVSFSETLSSAEFISLLEKIVTAHQLSLEKKNEKVKASPTEGQYRPPSKLYDELSATFSIIRDSKYKLIIWKRQNISYGQITSVDEATQTFVVEGVDEYELKFRDKVHVYFYCEAHGVFGKSLLVVSDKNQNKITLAYPSEKNIKLSEQRTHGRIGTLDINLLIHLHQEDKDDFPLAFVLLNISREGLALTAEQSDDVILSPGDIIEWRGFNSHRFQQSVSATVRSCSTKAGTLTVRVQLDKQMDVEKYVRLLYQIFTDKK
jgi:hypothetical protein